MQVEKDIIVACDYIEGNIYKKKGYRRVKLFTDQTLKSLKQIKLNNRDVLCKINSSDEVLDILSYKGNVLAYSDNRFDEYFFKLKLAALNLDRKKYLNYFMLGYGRYSTNFSYDTYLSIREYLDDKTRYFFDELYKKYSGKQIRKSMLFIKDKYSAEELETLVRYLIPKRYMETRENVENCGIKFVYSSDERILSKLKKLYNFIYLSFNASSLSAEEINKKERMILEEYKKYLKENGQIQGLYSSKKLETILEEKEYRENPSVNDKIVNIYTYSNKTIEK